MAQIHVIGRITADLVLKYSQHGKPYVRFDIAENIGSGDRARVQYYQVWAWGANATRLVDAKAHKGSHLWISGSLELEVYTKQDGKTTDKRMKVMLNDWSFIHIGSRSTASALHDKPTVDTLSPVCEGIDGDREALPE